MPDTSRNLLREYLADIDDHCPVCRYSLRGLQSDTCPECGIELILRVGLAAPEVSRVWLAGLVGICIASGPVFFNIFWILAFAIRRGALVSPGVSLSWLLLIAATSIASLAAIVAWLRYRRLLNRAPHTFQRRMAILGTLLTCIYPVSQIVRFVLW
ncbi:MAG: hypothetical protein H6812_00555 [Phycisphaeraceae bacterium]|nr:hypothetical protein [Phycisphaerales bacterium]MCB9841726.1 hypothetical protein [Phycisphaeraceae bacterium]